MMALLAELVSARVFDVEPADRRRPARAASPSSTARKSEGSGLSRTRARP
jgi:hypothetical protein